jgi:ribonuclease BN (tRNA processing enzyme)
MPMLKFIGRGSCFNHKEGNNSAYIKRDEHLLLIDCGSNIFDRIKASSLMDDVKNVHILITHFHDDHVGSLGGFILYCKYALNIIPELYFEDRNYLIKFLAFQGILQNEMYTCMVSPRIDEMNITFKAVMTDHYKFYRPDYNSCYSREQDGNVHMKCYFNCYGYFINDITDRNMPKHCYYSGDSSEVKGPIKMAVIAKTVELYQDTCLSIDSEAHMPLIKLCKVIPEEYRKYVYCMHIDSEETIELAKKAGFNVVEIEV